MKSPAARVLASTAGQIAAKGLHLAINIVSTLIVLRYLAPRDYGKYTLALTTALLLGLVADGGLARVAIREVAQKRIGLDNIAGALLGLRIGLSFAAAACAQGFLAILGASGTVRLGAFTLALVYLLDACFVGFALPFHVNLRQEYDTGLRLGGEAIETLVLIWLVASRSSVAALFLAPVAGATASATAAIAIAMTRFGLRPTWDPKAFIVLARAAATVIPSVAIGVAALRAGSFYVARLTTERDTGLFNAALQPVEYAFLATAVVVHVAYPQLAASWPSDLPMMRSIHLHTTQLLITLTLFVPVATTFASAALVKTVFGDPYRDAAPLLVLHAWTLPLMIIAGWNALVLLAAGKQRATLKYDSCALGLTVLAQPVLIGRWGTKGACVATLLVIGSVAVTSSWVVASRLSLTPDRSVAKPFVAAFVGVALGWVVYASGEGGSRWAPASALATLTFVTCSARAKGFQLRAWATAVSGAQRATSLRPTVLSSP